jgi:hypothetical protein
MADESYWVYDYPTEVTLKNLPAAIGKGCDTEIRFKHRGKGIKLTLHKSKRTSKPISGNDSGLDELSGDLTEVEQIQCWRKPNCRVGVEITFKDKDRDREAISCNEIETEIESLP